MLTCFFLLSLSATAGGEAEGSALADTFTVAIDPGHGGTNLGAAGVEKGVYEKRVTLALARKIRARLGGARRVQVVLCRDDDELVPIRARVRCGNQVGAQLFLSLHANAATVRGSQRGFELYVLPIASADRAAALAAARESQPAEAAWRLHRTHMLVESSLDAAKRIEWELSDALGRDRDRGIKQEWAALDVLSGLEMPGVLIEVGFIDHAEEGRELANDRFQGRIAAALARVISDLAARARRAKVDPSITATRKDRDAAARGN